MQREQIVEIFLNGFRDPFFQNFAEAYFNIIFFLLEMSDDVFC